MKTRGLYFDFILSPCTECCMLSFGQTECYETSAYKFQMPGNHPKESIQQEVFMLLTLLLGLYWDVIKGKLE